MSHHQSSDMVNSLMLQLINKDAAPGGGAIKSIRVAGFGTGYKEIGKIATSVRNTTVEGQVESHSRLSVDVRHLHESGTIRPYFVYNASCREGNLKITEDDIPTTSYQYSEFGPDELHKSSPGKARV